MAPRKILQAMTSVWKIANEKTTIIPANIRDYIDIYDDTRADDPETQWRFHCPYCGATYRTYGDETRQEAVNRGAGHLARSHMKRPPKPRLTEEDITLGTGNLLELLDDQTPPDQQQAT